MIQVAIQGIKGSFHHEASLYYFKDQEIDIVELSSFKNVCKSVNSNQAEFGVLAIENSIAGAILPNFKLIEKYELNIIGEIFIKVSMNLMALKGQKIEDINTVQSHAVAILQSQKFLSKYNDWTIIDTFDTASAAKNIVEKKLKNVAAVASKFVAKTYDLEILKEDIQNKENSYTRFFIVSKRKLYTDVFNKVSLYFTLEHKAGSLVNLLNVMAELNINLTKIQSIPLEENPYEYSFYVDLLIDNHQNYYNLLGQLHRTTSKLKILGEYIKDDFFKIK